MDGSLKIQNHPEQHYRTLFHQKTGFFVRKEEDGFPEPSWSAEGPELIDLSITSFCGRKCSFCYRRANNANYLHMKMMDIISVVDQAAACGTMQIALGGGNPNEHPLFEDILRLIREHDIVPSYTSNGDGLSNSILKATAEHCGAMAISVYPPYDMDYYDRLIQRIQGFGIKVNLHAILHSNTIRLWTQFLENPPMVLKRVNAIIFLNYKPMGKKRLELCARHKEIAAKFFRTANNCTSVKIGFDSCSISGIVNWMSIPDLLIEPCEAARFSAFISEDMKMYPCSFMVSSQDFGDLRKNSLIDIWKSHHLFSNFRESSLPSRCISCSHLNVCKGGCKLIDEINFCS